MPFFGNSATSAATTQLDDDLIYLDLASSSTLPDGTTTETAAGNPTLGYDATRKARIVTGNAGSSVYLIISPESDVTPVQGATMIADLTLGSSNNGNFALFAYSSIVGSNPAILAAAEFPNNNFIVYKGNYAVAGNYGASHVADNFYRIVIVVGKVKASASFYVNGKGAPVFSVDFDHGIAQNDPIEFRTNFATSQFLHSVKIYRGFK